MTSWREIDARLRSVAARRAALDVEAARWLRAAVEEDIHLRFGCVTMLEYLERALGYGPKVARERLRVAEALEELPVIESQMAEGKLAFSAARELTRVVTPETKRAWEVRPEGYAILRGGAAEARERVGQRDGRQRADRRFRPRGARSEDHRAAGQGAAPGPRDRVRSLP